MTDEEKKDWAIMLDIAKRNLSMPIDDKQFRAAQQVFLAADAELTRLRSLAERWYLADGTYETLPEEEVIRRRIEAAGRLKRTEDVEKIEDLIEEHLAMTLGIPAEWYEKSHVGEVTVFAIA